MSRAFFDSINRIVPCGCLRATSRLPRVRDVYRLDHYSRDLRQAQALHSLRRQREKVEWVDQGEILRALGTVLYPQYRNSTSDVGGGM